MWLADAEASYAIHHCERHSDEQKEHYQNAVKYYEIAEKMKEVTEEMFGNMGIQIVTLTVENISVPEEVEKALDEELTSQNDAVITIAERYMRNKEKTKENFAKLYRHILSKGFDYEQASLAVAHFKGDEF